MQLVARKNTLKNHRTLFRTEVESFVQQVARYARKNTHKNHRTSLRTEVESFVHQVARYARKNTHKNHRTSFRTEGKSFVHQNARDDMGKMRRCANVKQCKLKTWGVAVVDLWLFFEYHAEVKV